MLHFSRGPARLIYLTAPLAFLLLHAYIIYAPALMIVLYVLPHMIHASLTNARMQGEYRHSFWGEVYETVLAWYIARGPPRWRCSTRARASSTSRPRRADRSRSVRLAHRAPYLVLAALNVAGLGFAVWRLFTGPVSEIGTVLVSSAWVIYNLLIIGAAVAVASEVRQIRRAHRVMAQLPASLKLADGHAYPCTLLDFAEGGANLQIRRG